MSQPQGSVAGGMREPLRAALSTEVRRLEVAVARVSQLLYLGAIVAGLGVAIGASRPFGLWMAAFSAAYLLWYGLLAHAYERHRGGGALRVAAAVVDSTVPWVFALALLFTESAAYALSSWVPPMLLCALLVGAVVRLRPAISLAIGLSSGALFALFYFGLARSRLSASEAQLLVNQPSLQLARVAIIVLSGAAAAIITTRLRLVVGRAESAVRAQDLFGKYRLLRTIASGGMGEVFEALYCPEGGFERRVAVKRIHPHLAGQPKFVDAFRSEAELCARLTHPNLVQVMDFGRVGDSYFLAMEYVDGVTLGALLASPALARRPLEPDLVGFLGREILAGLAHAHEAARGDDGRALRVVHRDLCPQNVLLSRNGEVKIADFGVARALRDAQTAHTRTTAGHLGYLAPEQARGLGVDERTDLFAVGVMLWELMAGRRLFLLDTEAATVMALLALEPVPVSALREDADPAWDSFLEKSLAREPAARARSAREMAAALDSIPGARGERCAERLVELVEACRSGSGDSDGVARALPTLDLSPPGSGAE